MGSRLDKNSQAVRKRIEEHAFDGEEGEEYEASAFGGFGDYFRRKKIKLQNLDSELRASSSDKPQIFRGVVAHVTGYTQPPLHILHRDLVQHGAGFIQYLDSKTMATHIIASSLPPKKAVDFNKYRIVKPAWVTDSIKAGKMLPWSDYRVIEETPKQKMLKFDASGLATQSHTQQSPLRYREQTDNSFYTSQLRSFVETIDGQTKGRGDTTSSASDQLESSSESTGSGLHGLNVQANSTTHLPDGAEAPISTAPLLLPNEIGNDDIQITNESGDTAIDRNDGAEIIPIDAQKPMTSEEHNALLLQDPRMRKSSTANPDFIQQYYSESRLHHLSTWKAELKSKMQKLAAERGPQAKPVKRKAGVRRYIMHVDFDSFFCAVSLKSAPEYVAKPTVVAHGTGTGSEIASCNYPARDYGVKNGMWMKRAKELCPDLKVLPYDFPAYEEASRLFYECILEIGGVVQSVSIDEALVDVTSVVLMACGSDGSGVDEGSIWREQEKVDQIGTSLRDRIKKKTGCAVSVGIGGNILLAKVALRKGKPAGQYQIKPDEILDILGSLKVDSLPGVAYSIAGKLEEIGIKLVDDIRQTSKERLVSALGPKTGEKLWEYARGIDRVEVGDQPIRKSVSAEVNWGIRFINHEEAEEFVFNLCKELERRLLNEQVRGKQLTMKIMRRALDAPLDPAKHLGHGKCDTFNKSAMFGVATHDCQVLGKEAVSILRSYKFSPGDLRGLGVQLTKLEPIKSISHGTEGSQKKLSFGPFRNPGSAKKSAQDFIQDANSVGDPSPTPGRRVAPLDPIQDGPITPKKPKSHPALTLAKVNASDKKAQTPLNVGGTQFIIPSNADPAVLAELPQDIRSRLLAQRDRTSKSREQSPRLESGTRSPTPVPAGIDLEVFNALPDDMKAEVLASYGQQGPQHTRAQSPRKDRLLPPAKKTTPTKRRVPGLFARARERQADASAKVVQTNLFTNKHTNDSFHSVHDEVDELDPDILAELPEDVRKEVIADHRRRKAQRSGLDLKINQKRNQEAGGAEDGFPGGQTRLAFTPRPPKIAFTSGGLTSLPEIRDMLSVWYKETQEDGPHQRDVGMLKKYLVKVVLEERDMDKAVKLIRWLEYLADEEETESRGKKAWVGVVQDIRAEVDNAVKARGLGRLDMKW